MSASSIPLKRSFGVDRYSSYMVVIQALGDVGSLVGGLAAAVLVILAIVGVGAGFGDWRQKQQALRDVAIEEANTIRLSRQSRNSGWSPHGVDSFGVVLVTEPAEFAQAQEELAAGGPTNYVVMHVTSSANGGERLRDIVRRDGFVARIPNEGEVEAIEVGLEALGITTRSKVMRRATVG